MAIRLRQRSKYGAERCEVDGIAFHSRAEARRFGELKLLEKAGEVSGLTCQPRFELHAPNGEVVGWFVADFSYWSLPANGTETYPTAVFVVEDVKGMASLPLAKWKHKHLRAEYGIHVQEIRR
jgi:hypothetical protein